MKIVKVKFLSNKIGGFLFQFLMRKSLQCKCMCVYLLSSFLDSIFIFVHGLTGLCVYVCVVASKRIESSEDFFFCCVGGSRESVVDFFDFVFGGHVISRDRETF